MSRENEMLECSPLRKYCRCVQSCALGTRAPERKRFACLSQGVDRHQGDGDRCLAEPSREEEEHILVSARSGPLSAEGSVSILSVTGVTQN